MFIRTLQFRAEIVVYSLLDVLPFFILFFVWGAVYSQVEVINNYDLSGIVYYYLLVIFIERLTATHFEGWRSEEIRMGKIDYFLTRPFSYINELFSKELAGKLISILFSLPVLLIFYIVNVYIFNITQVTPELASVIIIIFLILSAYAIQFMIALWIVLFTFWLEGSSGLEHFKWIVLTLFSGAMIPIEFMPDWLQTIALSLPLKYVFAIPINVFQGKYNFDIGDALYVVATLIFMIIFSRLLWSKAQYKYVSAGG
jgi:ABC-2 type transport system permease protein